MNRSWKIAVVAFAALSCTSAAPSGGAEGKGSGRLDEKDFVALPSLRELDASVRAELFRRAGGGPMADTGGPFQSTDVVMDKLPSRRFVAGGRGPGGRWVVCYEHGGIAYHHHVALLRKTGESVSVEQAGMWIPKHHAVDGKVRLPDVLKALRHGELLGDEHW